MITDQTLKSYLQQIATLFCENAQSKLLCLGNLKSRFNQNLTNESFEVFLSQIQSGRHNILQLSDLLYIRPVSWNDGEYKAKFSWIDLVTGELVREDFQSWIANRSSDYTTKINNILIQNGFELIEGEMINKDNFSNKRVYYNKNLTPVYGITFVPQQVPGYVPPVPPGNVKLIPNEPVQKDTGIDLQSLFSNPILLIGSALVLYIMIKD